MREAHGLNSGTQKRSLIRRIVTAFMKSACILVMILLPISLAIAIGVPVAVKTHGGRHYLEERLSRTLRAPVEIGEASWSWRKGLRLRDVRMGPVAAEGNSLELHAIEARFKVNYRKLFSRKVRGDLSFEDVELRIGSGKEVATLPALAWPRAGKRGFRIEKLRVYGGSIVMDVPGEPIPLLVESVSLRGGLEVKRDRGYLVLHQMTGSLNGGEIRGGGTLSMSRKGTTSELRLLGSDVELDRPIASLLRHVSPAIGSASGNAPEGLVDFELHPGRAGWVSIREGRIAGTSEPVTLDASFPLGTSD